jgi:addiction module antitoxin, relB/dinJ family
LIANEIHIQYTWLRIGGVAMAQTMVNFRMDEKLKEKMEKTCKDMGLSVTAAYTMFATKVTREQRIPFEVTADPFFSEENMDRLRKNMAQMEKTGGTIHEVNLDD